MASHKHHAARVDGWGKEIAVPPREAWTRWARETTLRLERIDPIVPDERVREGRRGLPEILAWQGEPEAHIICGADGRSGFAA